MRKHRVQVAHSYPFVNSVLKSSAGRTNDETSSSSDPDTLRLYNELMTASTASCSRKDSLLGKSDAITEIEERNSTTMGVEAVKETAKEIKEKKIESYVKRLHTEIKSRKEEIEPSFFHDLFNQLETDEILRVLETPIETQDRQVAFFGEAGTMSKAQLQQYLEWIFSKVQAESQETVRLFKLLRLASVVEITTLTSHICFLNDKKLTETYLELISLFFNYLSCEKIINFITMELETIGLEGFFHNENAANFLAALLIRLTQHPYPIEISNLIITNILQADDLFIKMLEDGHEDTIKLLSILEKTADLPVFYDFLKHHTQGWISYIKEIHEKAPMFFYNYLCSLTNPEEIKSFAEIEGISEIIVNDINSIPNFKERKKIIKSLFSETSETNVLKFFTYTKNLEEVQISLQWHFLNDAAIELATDIDIQRNLKELIEKFWNKNFTINDVKAYLEIIRELSIRTPSDIVLYNSLMRMINQRVFEKFYRNERLDFYQNKRLDFYYQELSILFNDKKLTASQIAKLITKEGMARSSGESYCQLALSLMTQSNEAELGLKFLGLQEVMLDYIYNLELKEKAEALKTLFNPNSPLFIFFSQASFQVQSRIQWMKLSADEAYQAELKKIEPENVSVLAIDVADYSDCRDALNTMREAVKEKSDDEEDIILGFSGLQKRMVEYIEGLQKSDVKEADKTLDAFFESTLNQFFRGASHPVRSKLQALRMQQRNEAPVNQNGFFNSTTSSGSSMLFNASSSSV